MCAGNFIPYPFHFNSRFGSALRVQEYRAFSTSCNARMLSGSGLQRGRNQIAREFYQSSRIRLTIHQKLGNHARRLQNKIAAPHYGLSNIATFRIQSLAEGIRV